MNKEFFFTQLFNLLLKNKKIKDFFLDEYQQNNLKEYFPHLHYCFGFRQGADNPLDLFQHTILTIENIPQEYILLRLVALFHDLGKINTEKKINGKVRFFQHQFESASIFSFYAPLFPINQQEKDFVKLLIKEHMLYYSPQWSEKAVKKLLNRVGVENIQWLLIFCDADHRASKVPKKSKIVKLHKHLEKRINQLQ